MLGKKQMHISPTMLCNPLIHKKGICMKYGYMRGKELKPHFERMCKVAEQMPKGVPFCIAELFDVSEWEGITQYGHVTLGQFFRCWVDNGKVENVYPYGKQKPTQYIRR